MTGSLCLLSPTVVWQEITVLVHSERHHMAKKAPPPHEPESDRRKPEAVYRIGYVSASVFVHDVETDNGKRTLRSVNLQRRYKDGDETKYATSFGLAELPQAMRVLQLAQQHVESREAKLDLND